MAGPLGHLRVVDLTDVRGALAGRILADLGADVLKVELDGGDVGRTRAPFAGGVAGPDRALAFLYRNANKRGTVLPDPTRAAAAIDGLAAGADLLIENLPRPRAAALGLAPAALRNRHPHLIHVVLADFGLDGLRAGWRLEALPAFAASGALFASGFADGAFWVVGTADGFVRALPASPRQWRAFVELLGVDVLTGPEWDVALYRLANADVVRLLASEALRERPRAEVLAQARALDVPMVPVNRPDEFVDEAQTR